MKLPSGWITTTTSDGLTINLNTKELVMCKDCENYIEKHFQNGESYGCFCDISHMEMKPDDYCSKGVKKDGMD